MIECIIVEITEFALEEKVVEKEENTAEIHCCEFFQRF